MAIALIDSTGAGSTNNNDVTTPSIDTTGADFLVAMVSSGTGLTPTDSEGNTWAGLTQQTGAFDGKLRLWYVVNPTVGSGHTVSLSGSGESPCVNWAAFSGVDTSSPFDVQNGTSTPGNGSVQPGSITPNQDDSLVISAGGVFTTGALSVNGGFTITDQVAGVGGQTWGGALAYLIQTSAAAANPTWSASGDIIAVIAAFKPAGGGGGFVPFPHPRGMRGGMHGLSGGMQ